MTRSNDWRPSARASSASASAGDASFALSPRRTRALLERFDLTPRTGIGQHFVTDPNTVRRIVELAGVSPGARVIEVGPGLGALTVALRSAGAEVLAIETDRRLAPVLEEVAPGLDVRWDDAMRIDPAGLGEGIVVANLPYQIATPLLVEWLMRAPKIRSYTVMVQAEVGRRLVAEAGDDAYGAVSAKVALLADARIAMKVSRRVFHPMPDVESVVVRLDRLPRPRVAGGRERIVRVVEAGFAQRRKTIRRALRGAGWSAEDVERGLERAGIDGAARAETLSIERFGALARALPAR